MIPLGGGATYETVVDYADDAAGDSITLQILAQSLDQYTTT